MQLSAFSTFHQTEMSSGEEYDFTSILDPIDYMTEAKNRDMLIQTLRGDMSPFVEQVQKALEEKRKCDEIYDLFSPALVKFEYVLTLNNPIPTLMSETDFKHYMAVACLFQMLDNAKTAHVVDC